MRGDSGPQGVVPLRNILRNFLNLVESCEASVKDGPDLYEKEFQELKQFSENLKSDPAYLCKEGEKNVNRKKNRYKDILPFDYTRVILGDYGDVPGSDYINANFIKGASGSSAYIACQGPLPHTVNDFWRMVVECEVQVIVMACNEQESGKHKCENYWVEDESMERQFGQVSVWLKKCRQVCPDFLVRTMRIRYTNTKGESEERNVCQFHYSAWPDHGVPTKVRPLLDMVRLIRDCQTSETLPVLVHCSAGCGRTGTICAIDYVWGLLRLGKLTPDFSLFCLVREMRRQRIAMVQTKDQYVLVHRAVKELFDEQLKIIDSHPYANVDLNGLPLDIKSDLEEPMYETVEFHSNENIYPSVFHQSVASSPVLPIENVLKVKISPNLENHVKIGNHKQPEITITSPVSGPLPPMAASQSADEIIVLSSDNEETTDRNNESLDQIAISNIKTTSSKTSLLRKPSIVKLKAFFEKSKDDKKGRSTQLSRAKSDVSSLFYSFKGIGSSSSNSRGNTPLVSIKPLSTPPPCTSSESEKLLSPDKPKTKPALLAKPKLPVKRSKSLKLFGKAVETQDKIEDSSLKPNREQGALVDIDNVKKSSPYSKPGHFSKIKKPSSSDTGFASVTSNPIKVCVKQVEIPKMQAIVSKSVKQEAQTATTYDRKVESQNHKKSNVDLDIKLLRTGSSEQGQGSLKPVNSLETSNGSPTGGTSPSRIKMGMAKEMEDVFYKRSTPAKNTNTLKKYDTVTPKTLAAMSSSGTSLTRSQSHVWQQTKVELPPVRIFSDENIFFNSYERADGVASGPFFRDNNPRVEKDKAVGPKRNEHFESADGGSGFKNNSFFDEDFRLAHSRENPTARRRVPKTNPYTNYSPSVTNTKGIGSSKPEISKQNCNGRDKYVGSIRSKGESEGRDLPSLRSSHTRSRENSSESSSTTGTPRSSLPGTPTQTLDPSFTHLIKGSSVLNGVNNVKRIKASGNPPKSILKGSLSSTPSESDERLELSSRYAMSQPTNPILANSLTASAAHKMNTIRIAVGVRERRNSFRQAVWKEEQPLVNGNSGTNYQESPKNTHIFSQKGQHGLGDSTTQSSRPVVRSHKDYEPIWPEPHDNALNNHQTFRIEPNSFYVSIEDRNPIGNFNLSNRGVLNGNQIGRAGSSKDPSPYSSKESTPFGTQEKFPFRETKPSCGNRYEEIKVLLEELKAPPTNVKVGNVTSASSTNDFSTQLKPQLGEFQSRNMIKSSITSSNSLKHQRSLRAPSRPQYQQGLSCFTFRKPSSLESITDQLHAAESYAGFNSKVSSAYGGPLLGGGEGKEVPPPKGRHVNDYVSLRQCYTATSNPYAVQNGDHQLLCDKNDDSNALKTPIPPPRTKRAQQNARKNSQETAEVKPPTASSSAIWLSNGNIGGKAGGPTQSTNLPEVVRCAKYNQDNHFMTDGPPDSANPTSPKAIIRALGVFQAKAANMRSRFAHWTESKDRNNPKRCSDEDCIFSRDANEEKNNEGGFSSSVTSATQLPCPSRSKHQYL